ncbi:MAG: T9SS type A sorting domain-containing protein, partial [Flavobacteriales bacterium]|nr:T9SS type A sorting domain-containing protein [Flavobacteriales bacterium]
TVSANISVGSGIQSNDICVGVTGSVFNAGTARNVEFTVSGSSVVYSSAGSTSPFLARMDPTTGSYRMSPTAGTPEDMNAMEKQLVIDEQGQIKIFPNPNNGEFTLEMPGNATNIEVFDMTGRSIKFDSNNSGNHVAISLNGYDKGIYFIRIQMGTEVVSKQVIVQ